MSFWMAKAKKEVRCDVCGRVIKKGEMRLVYGYKRLAYTMIDRNVCLQCYSGLNPYDLAQSQSLLIQRSYSYKKLLDNYHCGRKLLLGGINEKQREKTAN